MLYLDTVRKKLDLKNSVVIGFRHRKQRIRHLSVLFIGGIIVKILLLYDFLNIRRISKIVDQTGVHLDLTVNILSCLLQNRLHVLDLLLPDQAAHAVMAVQRKHRHRN